MSYPVVKEMGPLEFRKFDYSSAAEFSDDARGMGLSIRLAGDLSSLGNRVVIGDYTLPNSMAFHPMEGCDASLDGAPGELTVRRYRRFAAGGPGLIWFEAVAVVPEGRASSRQLWINDQNVAEFAALRKEMRDAYRGTHGGAPEPLLIMQLTHSGRFSRPSGTSAPLIAYHNPILDETMRVDPRLEPVDDPYIESLEEAFARAAVLARDAGFHGVDIKACHRYLSSELLSAYGREGPYGGDLLGRTRFLRNVVDRVKAAIGKDAGRSFIIGTRLNAYDGIPHPLGWGMRQDTSLGMDLAEPLELVRMLHGQGVRLLNITMGTPYFKPHVNRPYDAGSYVPPEHPLEGVARLIEGAGTIQRAFPDMAVVGTGYSWARQFSPHLAAATLEEGKATLVGWGRQAIADPDFPVDLMRKGALEPRKTCICCSKCAEILRAGGSSGCVIRDGSVYGPIYNRCVLGRD